MLRNGNTNKTQTDAKSKNKYPKIIDKKMLRVFSNPTLSAKQPPEMVGRKSHFQPFQTHLFKPLSLLPVSTRFKNKQNTNSVQTKNCYRPATALLKDCDDDI